MPKLYRNSKGKLVPYGELTPEEIRDRDARRSAAYQESKHRANLLRRGIDVPYKTEGAQKGAETKALGRAQVQLDQARQKAAEDEFEREYRKLVESRPEESLEERLAGAKKQAGFDKVTATQTISQLDKFDRKLRAEASGRDCDARCKNSTNPKCSCACKGTCHGKGN